MDKDEALVVRRRTPEELTVLARRVLTREVWVTNDRDAIRNAFMMLSLMPPFSQESAQAIGAFIGDFSDTIPSRSMNGYPIFTSLQILHRDDLPMYSAELRRLAEALGVEVADAPSEPAPPMTVERESGHTDG